VSKQGGGFEITEWFNNVNGQKPTHIWFLAHGINYHFDTEGRSPMCSVDASSSITAICSTDVGGQSVTVQVYDAKNDTFLTPIGFWVGVLGKDVQP